MADGGTLDPHPWHPDSLSLPCVLAWLAACGGERMPDGAAQVAADVVEGAGEHRIAGHDGRSSGKYLAPEQPRLAVSQPAPAAAQFGRCHLRVLGHGHSLSVSGALQPQVLGPALA